MEAKTELLRERDAVRDANSLAPRRDRLKQLRSFCETVRLGSMSGAARAVQSSQPAVSAQLRALEEELGVALLRRQGGGIAPTRTGANLYRIARPLVEGLLRVPELFEELHHGAESGRLLIGAGEVSGGSILPWLVKRFKARYPRIRVEVRTGSGRERLEWLRGFELDLVIAAVNPVPGDIEFHPLVEVDGVVITPKDHPLAGRESVAIDELAPWPIVAPLAGHHVRSLLDVVLGLHGVHPPVALEVPDWGSMLNHVAVGVGIAVVPSVCVAPHEPVAAMPFAHRFIHRRYGLAHRRDRPTPLAVQRFVGVAVSEAAKRWGTPAGARRSGSAESAPGVRC